MSNEIRAKLFGRFRLENSCGVMEEKNTDYSSRPLLMLKYLLLNPWREVEQDEMVKVLWADNPDISVNGGIRVSLCRARKLLEPLGLDGIKGLLLYFADFFKLNPRYEISTDVQDFLTVAQLVRDCPLEEPEGLKLCQQALEIYDGHLLAANKSENAPWLQALRDSYSRELGKVAADMLQRMRVLNDDSAVALLSRRSTALLPENEPLHREIIAFLTERNKEEELLRHIVQLSGTGVGWLQSFR